MVGYYKETTSPVINGWLATGDLGYVDVHDYIYITGQKYYYLFRHEYSTGGGRRCSLPMKLFNELKELMQLRIDYLCCGEYSYLSQEYRRVSEAANQMYLLSIKYNLTRSQQELEHILENFDIVLKGEETILPKFLEAMKTI